VTHRKDLLKKGYRHVMYGSKTMLQRAVNNEKKKGMEFNYRIVPYDKTYHELYIKRGEAEKMMMGM
jgi:mannose/fructose/N-acetylgalactosamine-specific phosphotransferase system component IID